MSQEPKEVVTEDAFDKAFDDVMGNEQPQDTAQPETDESDKSGAVGEPAEETHSAEPTDHGKPDEKDKGFASHPAWIERENKLKEERKARERLESELSRISALLDDPAQLETHLKSKGFKIDKEQKNNGLFERIAQKRGWDKNRLTQDQVDYINDLIGVIQDVSSFEFEEKMGQRLKPIEESYFQNQAMQKTKTDLEQAQGLVEKFGFDWDKEVLPALGKYLDELDEKDPDRKKFTNINVVDWVKDYMMPLLVEKGTLQARQEKRDGLKKDAKGTTPSASQTPNASVKVPSWQKDPKGFNDAVDRLMDEMGVKD